LAQEKDILVVKGTLVQKRRIGGGCEIERDEHAMASYTPEPWSFWMSLEVLDDGSYYIPRKGSIRMSVFPPFPENTVTTHVIHLLWTISFRKGILDIGVE
jgi:hypothetical protein